MRRTPYYHFLSTHICTISNTILATSHNSILRNRNREFKHLRVIIEDCKAHIIDLTPRIIRNAVKYTGTATIKTEY